MSRLVGRGRFGGGGPVSRVARGAGRGHHGGSISAEARSAEREQSAGRSAIDGGHQIHLEKGVLDKTVEVNR